MQRDYKPLGNYIREVNVRNTDLKVELLLGVSIKKVFMPSIANIVGTDMRSYKILERNQFAYGPVTSRNGDKISIALLDDYDEAIISHAYTAFEIIDTNELNPEYLMMWFRRPEFDRYARFMSHGSAREVFGWEELSNTMLPIPSPEKQREIVAEYNTIKNRIALNNQLIQKLEETAQAIYKQWFVDFEFPDENGNLYKSTGGKMVWNEELDREIPEGWKVDNLETLIEFKNGKSKPNNVGDYPVYGGNGVLGYVNDYNNENVLAIGRVGAYCGSLYRELDKCWISDNAISAKSRNDANMFCYYLLRDLNLNERSEGTGQPLITQGLLNGLRVLVVPADNIVRFEREVVKIFKHTVIVERENTKLESLNFLVLSKLATKGNKIYEYPVC
ncbi:restriction endonuclease subunit S [Sunxiuqinia dokdonensis]|uniref:Restriction endonuclease S subunit n=1 Tax=Sunxiuqinia dokdonensis TaxID=1409788 RepID=A0A0L8V5V8_9BACT|nr:restriction endonuclease subunit S [Sunxiuqinia dokdonensis]KOH43728.1 restriction endonuclease S subunit [Sunxiuqinia dokdonensis]